ncbi:hypothetical protein F3Y22_tig00110328pilonHSYRG00824 [Hibiscus syriacus]|uniref:RNase H type-1 domain-containing protein n=1 Tax=Hibiscus syriacus TaxID=106335 RepID=A0A6A3B2R1_HIBSY|nr:hypothetical protein F3Y22_tig00110328pilonHSYRG00824 [Hibiscus syriacus]
MVPTSALGSFFSMNLSEWFHWNLTSHFPFVESDIPWNTLFSSRTWHVWKNRNGWVFNGSNLPYRELLQKSLTWARFYSNNNSSNANTPLLETIQWKGPDVGCYCLNVDGATSANTGISSIGGLIRDEDDNWFLGLVLLMLFRVQMRFPAFSLSLFRVIADLCRRSRAVDFQWTPREGNQPADALAKLARNSSSSTVIYNSPLLISSIF